MEKITELMNGFLKNKNIAGAASVVIKNGEIVYKNSLGYSDIENKIPVTEDTIYLLCSMSKPITALAVMKLFDEGKIALDDKLSKYIPEFKNRVVADHPIDLMKFYTPDPDNPLGPKALEEEIVGMNYVPAQRELTIYDCLSHSSGLDMGPISNLWLSQKITPEVTLAERVKLYAQAPGDFQPGESSGYSPMASFDTLGRIVEIVSGKDFETFLRDELFEPLGISDMGFSLSKEQNKRRAVLYEAKDGELKLVKPHETDFIMIDPDSYGYYSGSAGLSGSLSAYEKIVQLLLNKGEYEGKQLWKEETIEMMAGAGVPHDKILAPGIYWGLGMAVFEEPQMAGGRGLAPNSFGWSGAFGTHFYIDWENNMAALLMLNITNIGGAASPVSMAFEKAVYQSFITNN